MDDSGPTAYIILGVLFVLIDLWMYGFDSAIKAVNEPEIERKAEKEKDRKAIFLGKILDAKEKYNHTILTVVTANNLLMGYFCLSGIWKQLAIYSKEWLGDIFIANLIAGVLAVVLSTFIVVTIGILLPRKLAEAFSEKWAYFWMRPTALLVCLLTPFTFLASATADLVPKLIGDRRDHNDADVIEDEIISMVHEGHEQGYIEASEARMITNIFEFGDKEAQDICTNRSQIVAFPIDITLKEATELMLQEKYSRYPVYEDTIDHITGVLYMKDIYRLKHSEELADRKLSEIPGLLRAPFYVPQTKKIDELFRRMQAEKVQMAIVIDEYGQTDGLVAMEDILEEIVGNILDEYDDEGEYIEETGVNEYIIDGLTPLDELEERFKISFDGEPFETLNGFLISRLDRIPDENESFNVDYQGYNFSILSVEHKVITSVLVKRLPEQKTAKEESTEDFS